MVRTFFFIFTCRLERKLGHIRGCSKKKNNIGILLLNYNKTRRNEIKYKNDGVDNMDFRLTLLKWLVFFFFFDC